MTLGSGKMELSHPSWIDDAPVSAPPVLSTPFPGFSGVGGVCVPAQATLIPDTFSPGAVAGVCGLGQFDPAVPVTTDTKGALSVGVGISLGDGFSAQVFSPSAGFSWIANWSYCWSVTLDLPNPFGGTGTLCKNRAPDAVFNLEDDSASGQYYVLVGPSFGTPSAFQGAIFTKLFGSEHVDADVTSWMTHVLPSGSLNELKVS